MYKLGNEPGLNCGVVSAGPVDVVVEVTGARGSTNIERCLVAPDDSQKWIDDFRSVHGSLIPFNLVARELM